MGGGGGVAPSGSGRSSPNPTLGSSPVFSKMFVDAPGSPVVMAYPNPHVPPFPAPTLVQPVAQLRQPYLVSTIGAAASGAKKHASGAAGSSSSSGRFLRHETLRIRKIARCETLPFSKPK